MRCCRLDVSANAAITRCVSMANKHTPRGLPARATPEETDAGSRRGVSSRGFPFGSWRVTVAKLNL